MPFITTSLKVSNRFRSLYLLSLLLLTGLSSCTDECETTITYTVQEPILMKRSELAQAVKSEPAHALSTTGKIYTQDGYIFINEPYQGIHVIDNSDPKTPKNIAFISIPGNVDIAIRDHFLFADAGPDLLTLNISDPTQAVLINHHYNLFSPTTATSGSPEPSLTDMVTIGYNTRIVTQERACDDSDTRGGWVDDSAWGNFNNSAAPASSPVGGTTGLAGSMARFAINRQHLYAINSFSMRVVDISNPAAPQPGNVVSMAGGIETIFPYHDKLFIGTNSGMLIYDIEQAATPTYLGRYSHMTLCDPVVVSGDYAYVTLRSNQNGSCGGTANQLDVVDISNPSLPVLRKTFPMQSPYGLGIDANTLFVCEGSYGLKVFNAENPLTVGNHQLAYFKDIDMFDVIPLGNTLLAVGTDGLYQFDYTDPKNIKYLSRIPVNKAN